MSLYKNVQDLCEKNNISIAFLEIELEFPRGSLYKWDAHKPSIEKVKKVADYFGVQIEEIVK